MDSKSSEIQVIAKEGIDEDFLKKIQRWSKEILEKTGPPSPPSYLCITIWKTINELRDFYQREREELGVVTGEETDFLATHEAWRGYPRIHICQERLRKIADALVQAVIYHEISHALHHGTQEFYTFRFSKMLQEAGHTCGLDLPLLQQCVYLLSVAIKDWEVVQWLSTVGLGLSQQALLEYMISDTKEERRIWEMIRDSPAPSKIALASFLKIILPIEAMVSLNIRETKTLRDQWNEAYGWLSEREKEGLLRLCRYILEYKGKGFQDRLENATFRLLNNTTI